uniref:RNA-directed DNA polymerase, eukaryota n=1 Tax=Tanacetum cinerariifolium TaxID=118510 RepID=A0A699GXR6_TANCI|nr:RNA-directed DNA polymerase, eukaryota [Tanacetum cinerariifolium]
MLDGVWNSKPKDIKSTFLDFYKDKFSCHDFLVSLPPMLPAHRLSIVDQDFLESMVTMDEIKRYLDYVLDKSGFGIKWCNWIRLGLASARTYIIINGSPTSEFSLKIGLKQGDPLPPFLFIIVMDGLHMALNDGLAANMFHDVNFEDSKKLDWVKWSTILASLNKGGLSAVKAIHGDEACIDIRGCHTNGVWANIVGKPIDELSLPSLSLSTRWCKIIPRKVNIFMWQMFLDGLPYRLNFSSRGLDIDSIMCPVYNISVESSAHTFFSCDTTSAVWKRRIALTPSLMLPVGLYGGLEIISLSTLILKKPLILEASLREYLVPMESPDKIRTEDQRSRHYTLDKETYPLFLDKDREDMDIFAFIHTSDPTKVKVVKRERKEDKPRLLETIIGHTVPLLLVVPDRGESELDANVDKLFDEGGSGTQTKQGDSVGGGGEQGMNIQPITETTNVVAEDNAKVRGEPIPTIPFVRSSVFATPEGEGKGHTDSVTGLNLQTISVSQRFVISSDSSHHSSANIAEANVDSFTRPSVPVITATTTITSIAKPIVVVKEKIFEHSLFADESTFAGGTDPANAGLTYLTDSDYLVGGIRTIINTDSDLQKTYVPQWNVTNGSRLDDGSVYRDMVDEFAPPMFFASVRGMEHDQLFTEFNVGAARQMSLSAEVRMQAEAAEAIRLRVETSKLETTEKSLRDEVNALNERNTILEKERNALDVKVTDLEAVFVHELQVSSSEIKGKLSNYENLTERLEEFQDVQLKVINDKFDKLYTDFVKMSLHLEERLYPYLLTTIVGRIWLLTYGMQLAITMCLNSHEYLSTLRTTISKAIEKGMQDGLATKITHGKEGWVLTDVAAHNPSAEADYLMVLIHHSPDKTVVGASALSLALEVSDARVQSIRENIMSHRSLFQDVFIPLAEPFSAAAVTCTEGTFDTVPATIDTTAALSITFASAGIVDPISIDDYEVTGTNDQPTVIENVADENASPFS